MKPNASNTVSFSLKKLWIYFVGTVAHPARTFEAIAAEGSLLYPTVVMTIFGILYSTLSLLIYLQGHQPSLPILILVPPQKFYLIRAIYLMFWLPDLASTLLFGQIFTIPMSIYGTAWFVWVIYLSGVGLKITHHISIWKGAIISLIAFLFHFSIGFFSFDRRITNRWRGPLKKKLEERVGKMIRT